MKWGIITFVICVFSGSGYSWSLWETAIEEPGEMVLEETQVYSFETYEKAYGYLRGSASIVGGGCLVALVGFGVISFPVASLAAFLIGIGSTEIIHAYNIIDYSNPFSYECFSRELEDTPLWKVVDKFGWQELIAQDFLTTEQMRIKFFEDTKGSPFHEIEIFYSLPAITAQGFLHEDEAKMLMEFHRDYLRLQEDEQQLREVLAVKYAEKIGNALQNLGISAPWTTRDFIFFKITPEKAMIAFSEDLKQYICAHHLTKKIEQFKTEILSEAVEDYKTSFEDWRTQVACLDTQYFKWRDRVICF